MIISQYIQILNHYVIHLKLIFVNYTSIIKKNTLYLVITYCVSGTVLGPWDTAVNKTNRIPTVMDLRAVGKTDNTQTDK